MQDGGGIVCPAIVAGIRLLQRARDEGYDSQSSLSIDDAQGMDLFSVQYLANFLHQQEQQQKGDDDTHQLVTEFELSDFYIQDDAGDANDEEALDVFCRLFANNTTLTTVRLYRCDFGGMPEALQVITAFQTNRFVTDLTICNINNIVEETVLGGCISNLLHNNTTLQKLDLEQNKLNIRTLQPGLRSNRYLKILELVGCHLDDEDLGLITDALVGNTIIEVLNIDHNDIESNGPVHGLFHIIRLVEFTKLKKISAYGNHHLFDDANAMNTFMSILPIYTNLESFDGIDLHVYPQYEQKVKTIYNIMYRNRHLKRANALLEPLQPSTGLPISSKSGIWYTAMSKMGKSHHHDDDDNVDSDAAVPTTACYPGASAIFQILQSRPALLEKQLPKPTVAATPSIMQRHNNDNRPAKLRRLL